MHFSSKSKFQPGYSLPHFPYSPGRLEEEKGEETCGKCWHQAWAREVFPWCLFLTSSDFWAKAEEANYVMSRPKFKPQEAGDESMRLPYSWFFISSWMVSFKKGLNHGCFPSWYSCSSPPPWAPPLPGPVRLVAGQPGSWSSGIGEGIPLIDLLSTYCVPGTKCFVYLFLLFFPMALWAGFIFLIYK